MDYIVNCQYDVVCIHSMILTNYLQANNNDQTILMKAIQEQPTLSQLHHKLTPY